jgi:succinoglycan biosynthesis transport protein ExoP
VGVSHVELEREVDIRDYIRIIRRRFWIILSVFGFSLILTILYFIYSPPLYTSSSTILVKKVETLFGGGYFPSPTEEELTNHIYLLKSDPVLRKTAISFTKEELEKIEFSGSEAALRKIKADIENGQIEIGTEGESRIIKIKVTEINPYRSLLIANRLAMIYRDFDIEMKREDAHSTYSFIENQVNVVRKDLEEAEKKLKAFKEEHGILGLSAEVEGFIQQMAEIEKEFRKASVEAQALEMQLKTVESRLGEREKMLLSEASETSYELLLDLKEQLTSLENQRADLLIQGYSTTDQKIQSVEHAVSSVKIKMDEVIRELLEKRGILNPLEEIKDLLQKSLYLTVDWTVAKTRKEAFKDVLSYYEEKLKEIPERDLMLAQLEREKQANENIYMMLIESKEQVQISEVSERGDIFILDLAVMPKEPNILSKVKKGILFIILGFLLGIGVGFIVDYIDSAIRDEGEISRVSGLPVLASIPLIDVGRKETFILTDKNLSSSTAESFRRLRTNIKLSRADGLPSSILVTGPNKGSGKSMIAINLALSFASVGERIILVDTDLRRASIGSYLGISNSGGLTDLLIGQVEKPEIFKFNSIDVISSGTLPPNPSELLDSVRMRELIKRWEEDYDLVILDSPPLLSVSDSSILANEVEETLIVVSYGETTRSMITQTAELLKRLSIKTLGFVMNKVHFSREYGYYHYYYKDYKGYK